MSKKGAVDIFAAIIITVISITFASTLYLYSTGIIKGTMTENFKLVDIFGNRVVIKNIGREDIEDLKCMVDGTERRCVIAEASIIPGKSGNVLIEGITPGIHDLQLYTKSMSQKLTWEAEAEAIVELPNPTTTTTTIIGETSIIELSANPNSFQIPQNVIVTCRAQRKTGDDRRLHLDIRLNDPAGKEILNSGNLGDNKLDVTYEIPSSIFSEKGGSFSFYMFINFFTNSILQIMILSGMTFLWSSLLVSFKTGYFFGYNLKKKEISKLTLYLLVFTFFLFYQYFLAGNESIVFAQTSGTGHTPTYDPAQDFDNDGKITEADVQAVADHFQTKVGDPNYDPSKDLNGDGVINILDVTAVAVNYGAVKPTPFDHITTPTIREPTTVTTAGQITTPTIREPTTVTTTTITITNPRDYKVICNLRETSLLIDPLIDSKNVIVTYSITPTTTTIITTTTTAGSTTTSQATSTATTTTFTTTTIPCGGSCRNIQDCGNAYCGDECQQCLVRFTSCDAPCINGVCESCTPPPCDPTVYDCIDCCASSRPPNTMHCSNGKCVKN